MIHSYTPSSVFGFCLLKMLWEYHDFLMNSTFIWILICKWWDTMERRISRLYFPTCQLQSMTTPNQGPQLLVSCFTAWNFKRLFSFNFAFLLPDLLFCIHFLSYVFLLFAGMSTMLVCVFVLIAFVSFDFTLCFSFVGVLSWFYNSKNCHKYWHHSY